MFTKKWLIDTSERVVSTFAEAALGIWIAAGATDLFSVSTAKGAAAAGIIAAASLVKSILAGTIGNKDSASLADVAPVESATGVNV